MVLGQQVIYPVNLSPLSKVERPHCFLFDNGSLRAASTLSLRRTAALLSEKLDTSVQAVSLLHSSGVSKEQLGGSPAELLEPALLSWLTEHPEGSAVLLPLFFGPSGALMDYVPERLQSVRSKFPRADVRLARCLVDPRETDTRIARALADAARATIQLNALKHPKVLLVDHGSPQHRVATVRDHLGDQIKAVLGSEIAEFNVTSMERRPGPDYAFNDPLLANTLGIPPYAEGDVVVLLQFLAPGRHAGPHGDIAEICDEAARGCSSLQTYLTEPIAHHPFVAEVLLQRYEEAIANGPATSRSRSEQTTTTGS